MLAYIFWHRPFAHVDRKAYEAAIVRFQRDLAAQPPPGFIAAASYRIEPVAWLSGQPGYEDWYLIEASWAIDPLNGFAITGPQQPSHDRIGGACRRGLEPALRPCRRRAVDGRGVHGVLADAPARHSVASCVRARARRVSAGLRLAPADGVGTRHGVCRGSAGSCQDRRAVGLAIAPREARAAARPMRIVTFWMMEETNGEGRIRRPRRDGVPDGRASQEQGRPRRYGL